jgi:Fe-S cluster biogenesis protein NfuA
VRGGDVHVRATHAGGWREIAADVRAAILLELDALDASPDHWLARCVGEPILPSIADVQAIVDSAAGALLSAHGGAITVAAVDATGVRLRAGGACDGCRQSDQTVLAVISPAIRAVHPDIGAVVLIGDQVTDRVADRPDDRPDDRAVDRVEEPAWAPVAAPRRGRRRHARACH